MVLIVIAVNMMVYFHMTGYSHDSIMVVYFIGLSTIISSFYGVFNSVFQAHERMEYQSLGQVINSGLLLFGSIVAISLGMGIVAWAAIYLVASIATALFEIIVCAWKFAVPTIKFDRDFIIIALKESLPFGLTGSFITIYYMVSSVLLQAMVSTEAVGYYNAAYKMVLFLGFIPTELFGAVFPVSSRLFTSSKDTLRFLFERSLKYLIIFAIPIGIGTTLLADRLIVLVCGPGFVLAGPALAVLIWSEVFIFINMALGNMLNSINRQTVITKQTALSAVVNVALNIAVIPYFGYIGACAVTVITEAIALVFLYRGIMSSEFKVPEHLFRDIVKVTAASLLMGAVVYILNGLSEFQGNAGLIAILVIGIAIYFVLIFFLSVLDANDKDILKRLVLSWRNDTR
jgi:O-antigen/teichoic acid export membrane protein